MFGKREPEKRSLEEMFTPRDVVDNDAVEEREDLNDVEQEGKKKAEASIETVKSKIVPFDCFGIEEEKTEKWIAKCIKFWFCCMSFLWFLFGALTFAPVIYISNKVNVIFKDKKKSLLCATIIHGIFMIFCIIFLFLR